MEGGVVVVPGCAEGEEVLRVLAHDKTGGTGGGAYFGGFGDAFAEDFDFYVAVRGV